MSKKREESPFERHDRLAIIALRERIAAMKKLSTYVGLFDQDDKNMVSKSMRDWLDNHPDTADLHMVRCVAHVLHSLQCRYNHTDGCGWYYHDIDRNTPHIEYMKKAMTLIEQNGEECNVELLKAFIAQQRAAKTVNDLIAPKKKGK